MLIIRLITDDSRVFFFNLPLMIKTYTYIYMNILIKLVNSFLIFKSRNSKVVERH